MRIFNSVVSSTLSIDGDDVFESTTSLWTCTVIRSGQIVEMPKQQKIPELQNFSYRQPLPSHPAANLDHEDTEDNRHGRPIRLVPYPRT